MSQSFVVIVLLITLQATVMPRIKRIGIYLFPVLTVLYGGYQLLTNESIANLQTAIVTLVAAFLILLMGYASQQALVEQN